MPSQPDIVREWLGSLGTLTGGSAADAEARLRVYVPYLLQAVPIEAFTPASVQEIARSCRFMPSYAELCDKLEAWWSHNRPDKPLRIEYERTEYQVNIPARRPEPDEDEVAAVSDLVTGLTRELADRRAAFEAANPPHKPRLKPFPLSDGQLLATYEAMGEVGVVRAQMLRRKLAGAALERSEPVATYPVDSTGTADFADREPAYHDDGGQIPE